MTSINGFEELSLEEAFEKVSSRMDGLSDDEVARRQSSPSNGRKSRGKSKLWSTYFTQFKSPILVLLVTAALLSGFLGEWIDAATILSILFVSSVLSFFQEYRATAAVQELLKLVQPTAYVRRGGHPHEIPAKDVVRGDVVLLKSGSSIPGDGLVIESANLLIDEAALTGESAPAEKSPDGTGNERVIFAGTHVQSGSGTALMMEVGEETTFESVVRHVGQERPEPQFHKGIRQYGYVLMEFTLLLTLVVMAINVSFKKPVVDSLLFSLALAVGLTPQLLPAIMSVTLASGAKKLAEQKVIVKRLEAIEDFGSMDLLCSDKTGTLTVGKMHVEGAYDADGNASLQVLEWAQSNAKAAESFENPIDQALLESSPEEVSIDVVGIIPYDFSRKRQSVIVKDASGFLLITKGAMEQVAAVCMAPPSNSALVSFRQLSERGLRVLGLAIRRFDALGPISIELESQLEFVGLVAFEDPLRADSKETVATLRGQGVHLKLITGDNRLVARQIGESLGLIAREVLTGEDLRNMPTPSLARRIRHIDIFAEVDPIDKERLILAFKKAGHVVGYIGDGINDGPALHAADVGLSVQGAASVAREAADLVMLDSGLKVISNGITEGRQIFANTLKYVFVTTSANFGNMFSMAAASLFLPFLPLLPKQILLNNFLTDIPAMSIAGDSVDVEWLERPQRWDVKAVRNFMLLFGLQSSIFDILSFWVLLNVLKASPAQFRTGWFLESALSEILILLVIRTRKTCFRSRPGPSLLLASAFVFAAILLIVSIPSLAVLGFTPLPAPYFATIGGILVLYVLTAELLKVFQVKTRHAPIPK